MRVLIASYRRFNQKCMSRSEAVYLYKMEEKGVCGGQHCEGIFVSVVLGFMSHELWSHLDDIVYTGWVIINKDALSWSVHYMRYG